ncbi:hypothetical protein [Paraconexibacter algicola]|uniref:Collagen-like protein n=1 Tax=Paraconexibacter algicola TaxID=2133960 RepID=A0A2T4UD81_9ACTN|nr:hypothetical protein [Paraconexibacter algicola]PTL55458.1 hypothetical protein C7Y72_17540 [Paraconexibacter algicola]
MKRGGLTSLLLFVVLAMVGTGAPAWAQDPDPATTGPTGPTGVAGPADPTGPSGPSGPAPDPQPQPQPAADPAPAPSATPEPTPTPTPAADDPGDLGGAVGLVVGRIIGAAISTPTSWEFTPDLVGELRELRSTLVVRVTTTDRVTIGADDADSSGSARGRIATSAGRLGLPIVASADGRRQALSEPVRPPLVEFDDAITNSPVRIELTQRVRKGQQIKDLRQKHVMVTIAPPVP